MGGIKGVLRYLASAFLLFSVLLQGCATHIGAPAPEVRDALDFGASQTVDICLYKVASVSNERLEAIMRAVQDEFSQYGIRFNFILVDSAWERRGFTYRGIYKNLIRMKLEEPCDRQVFLVGRHAGDYLYGIFSLVIGMPEVLGVVDEATSTVMFVVANRGLSFNQILMNPLAASKHEFYHLFGCGHADSMGDCYKQIALIKRRAELYERHGNHFFPGFSHFTHNFI